MEIIKDLADARETIKDANKAIHELLSEPIVG